MKVGMKLLQEKIVMPSLLLTSQYYFLTQSILLQLAFTLKIVRQIILRNIFFKGIIR